MTENLVANIESLRSTVVNGKAVSNESCIAVRSDQLRVREKIDSDSGTRDCKGCCQVELSCSATAVVLRCFETISE
ncbi:hypothetical protein TNCV_1669881 [Trichonephila clavipes]|nr:hypothetical protein TNCV_1669881 [Trichonephila clavipes]